MALTEHTKANLLLLLAAMVWGFAFVAQRSAMQHLGPFSFTAIRFGLGSLIIAPFALREHSRTPTPSRLIHYGIVLGVFLCAGISLQQVGLVTTSAGNGGFITGLYMVFVPVVGSLVGVRTRAVHWLAVALGTVGLFFLCYDGSFRFNRGDVYTLLGALVWAVHVLLVDRFVRAKKPFTLAALQYAVCMIICAMLAGMTELVTWSGIWVARWEIAYASIMSVGLGYTLQVVAQQYAEPAQAGVVLSMESVFALLGGAVLLGEALTTHRVLGAGLMFVGMVSAQLPGKRRCRE